MGCIQPKADFTPFSVITLVVDVPVTVTRAGIRVTVSGSGATAGDNDYAFTDTTGFASIKTQQTGYHFVVARHQTFDITAGGTAANLIPGGEMQVFQQGRLYIPNVGAALSPDFFYPFTGVDSPPQKVPKKLGMVRKTPGKARFMFIAEDSEILKNTLQPSHQPQPLGTVSVTGDWNEFNLTQEDVDSASGARFLYDDGSLIHPESGDDIAGDGIYTRVLDLTPGNHTYAFMVNGIFMFYRDPYEETSKQVRAVVRIPEDTPGTPGLIEVREFRASQILVTEE